MAKARKILKRAKAIKSIRTVTKTMEMVSTARFRRTAGHAAGLRPYTDRSADLVADLIARAGEGGIDHPLVHDRPEVRRDVLLVLMSNRGLCGGYNAAMVRLASERIGQLRAEGYQVRLHVAGKKGASLLRRRGHTPDRVTDAFDHAPDFAAVSELVNALIEQFLRGEISGLEIAYMQFVSSGVQRPAVAQMLPLTYLRPPPGPMRETEPLAYEFMPSEEEILNQLLPASVRVRAFQCFLDAAVSEQVARMSAMRAATDSADDMIRQLNLDYNRIRQGQITNELAEIMGGSEAVGA